MAKAIQEIGSALAFVAAARYLAGLYGERRNHFALGLYGGGFPLGSAVALVVMPPLAAALGGWRGAFWAEAAVVGAAAVAWWRAPSVPCVARPGNIRSALRCPNCWLASLQHAAGFGLAIAAGTWITVYLLREFRLPWSPPVCSDRFFLCSPRWRDRSAACCSRASTCHRGA